MMQRIVAAGFAAAFVGEVRLPAQGLNRLVEQGASFVGALGVVEVDGGLRSGRQVLTGRGFGAGLGVRERRKQQEKGESLHYYYFRSSGDDFSCMGQCGSQVLALASREREIYDNLRFYLHGLAVQ